MLLLAGVGSLVVGALVTSLAVPLVAGMARAVRAMDYPGGRRRHSGAVPRLGGLAIAAGITFGAGGAVLVTWRAWGSRVSRLEVGGLLVGLALVFLVGLVDDLIGVSAWKRLATELVAAGFVVSVGWRFDQLAIPGLGTVHLGTLGVVLSVVWVAGVTNAINLLDGLDGLAAGVTAIIAASLAVYSLMQQNVLTVVLMAAITGSCLGFLRYNWEPAKIFMGDAGSLSLGFLIAATTVHASLKASAAVAIVVPLLALGVPVIDTLMVMLVRFLDRSEGSVLPRILRMFKADRNHLHHLLEAAARHRRRVVGWIYGLVGAFCGASLWVAATKNGRAGLVLVAVEIAVVFVVRSLGLSRRMRAMSRAKREALRREVFGETGESGTVTTK